MRRRPQPATGAIIGRRPEQQDAVLAAAVDCDGGEPGLLLVVADGMGGHAGGQIASAIAVETFQNAWRMGGALPAAERLRAALEIANRAIGARMGESPELRGMGCTLVAALVVGDRVRWISVGDSLLIAIRNRESIRLNADHSMAPEIDRAALEGRISRAQADSDPDRHVLLSALNGGRIEMIDEGQQRLGAGAFVLLATDGLLTLPPSRIAELGSGPQSADRKVAALLQAVIADMPADQDNTSIAAVHCGGPLKGGRGLGGRTALAALLLSLALAGGGYAAWLISRPDDPPAPREDRNIAQPAPEISTGAGGLATSGPSLWSPDERPGVRPRRPGPDRPDNRRTPNAKPPTPAQTSGPAPASAPAPARADGTTAAPAQPRAQEPQNTATPADKAQREQPAIRPGPARPEPARRADTPAREEPRPARSPGNRWR